MTKKNSRVVKYKQRRNINIGVIIFGVTFIYLAVNLILYFTKNKVTYYEVVQGSTASTTDKSYTGIALRDEIVQYTDKTGYVNYYVREGNRVGLDTTLYTLDESGSVNDQIKKYASENTKLSDDDIKSIKQDINGFTGNFQDMTFDRVYDFKNTIDETIMQLFNANSLTDINSIISKSGSTSQFEINKALSTGIVTYYIDNFETVKPDSITKESFDTMKYNKTTLSSDQLFEKNSPVYKTVSNEYWTIVIPMSDDDLVKYIDQKNIHVKFLKDNVTCSAKFSIDNLGDGNYGVITLDKYMGRYATERFLNIQILGNEISGLKIPKTSVTKKDFYIIPKEYGNLSSDGESTTFNLYVAKGNGNYSVKAVSPTIYGEQDDNYLIDKSDFEDGDIVVKSNSNDKYRIESTVSLSGVYNINNGYTIFREINILAESNEYYIVDAVNTYGLNIYDHIILDVAGSNVSENQILSK